MSITNSFEHYLNFIPVPYNIIPEFSIRGTVYEQLHCAWISIADIAVLFVHYFGAAEFHPDVVKETAKRYLFRACNRPFYVYLSILMGMEQSIAQMQARARSWNWLFLPAKGYLGNCMPMDVVERKDYSCRIEISCWRRF